MSASSFATFERGVKKSAGGIRAGDGDELGMMVGVASSMSAQARRMAAKVLTSI